MNLAECQLLANELMARYIPDKGYYFVFDNSKRRFGCCHYGTRHISMSRTLVELNPESEVRDVILHEIAHVLAGAGASHGPLWMSWCVKIGARPERCYDSKQVVTPPAKYQAECHICHHVYKKYKKPPTGRTYSCPCTPRYQGLRLTLSWVKVN